MIAATLLTTEDIDAIAKRQAMCVLLMSDDEIREQTIRLAAASRALLDIVEEGAPPLVIAIDDSRPIIDHIEAAVRQWRAA